MLTFPDWNEAPLGYELSLESEPLPPFDFLNKKISRS
jgi:hypothetical protein